MFLQPLNLKIAKSTLLTVFEIERTAFKKVSLQNMLSEFFWGTMTITHAKSRELKKNGKNSYGIKKKMEDESGRERNRDDPKSGFFPAHATFRCKCLCTKTCAWNY